MAPLNLSDEVLELKGSYLTIELLQRIWKQLSSREKKFVIRQWFSEGIPYAFRDYPAIYEAIRDWLSVKLNVDAKSVSMIGSCRSGFSLNPEKLGRAFTEKISDLDLFIVSDYLFDLLQQDLLKFKDDWEQAKISPHLINLYSEDNVVSGIKRLNRGFVDSNKIPNVPEEYPTASNVNNICALLMMKIEVSEVCPRFKKSLWIRVFKNWDSMLAQNVKNLDAVLGA